MRKQPKYKSDAFEAIHASADALLQVGAISKATMRSFDESCLVTPHELAPKMIKLIREKYHVSQPVFARYLKYQRIDCEAVGDGCKTSWWHGLKAAFHCRETWLEGSCVT